MVGCAIDPKHHYSAVEDLVAKALSSVVVSMSNTKVRGVVCVRGGGQGLRANNNANNVRKLD